MSNAYISFSSLALSNDISHSFNFPSLPDFWAPPSAANPRSFLQGLRPPRRCRTSHGPKRVLRSSSRSLGRRSDESGEVSASSFSMILHSWRRLNQEAMTPPDMKWSEFASFHRPGPLVNNSLNQWRPNGQSESLQASLLLWDLKPFFHLGQVSGKLPGPHSPCEPGGQSFLSAKKPHLGRLDWGRFPMPFACFNGCVRLGKSTVPKSSHFAKGAILPS